jgi:hypothetical protein
MTAILHDAIPDDMQQPRALPGVQPLVGPWVRVDEAYAGQMALRRALISDRLRDVYRAEPGAEPACAEVLEAVLPLLPSQGFQQDSGRMRCPDGAEVSLEAPPLVILGQLIQSDICILQKQGAEHVLTAACLCFPASWRLQDKIGRRLVRIHAPVDSYDLGMAARVQRLFDGVQVGKPLWRFNRLTYADPDLHQPRDEYAPRQVPSPGAPVYTRSERQSIIRLPKSQAVVFAIHTYVVKEGAGRP